MCNNSQVKTRGDLLRIPYTCTAIERVTDRHLQDDAPSPAGGMEAGLKLESLSNDRSDDDAGHTVDLEDSSPVGLQCVLRGMDLPASYGRGNCMSLLLQFHGDCDSYMGLIMRFFTCRETS